jgi:hypothetical protein
MPLPDKHANEPTVEVDRDIVKLMQEAKAEAKRWKEEYERLRKKFEVALGDAYAATVDGEKVFTYRPKDAYAEARLREDYPDLTEHYVEWAYVSQFNFDKFKQAHPDIAKQYQSRQLVEVKTL